MEYTAYNIQKRSYLGITSLLLSLAGFTILPVVGSIAAILTGGAALKEPAGQDDSFAKAGIFLGWLNLVLCVVLTVVAVLSMIIFTARISM